MDRVSITVGEKVTVGIDATNASDVVADEAVQLYIHQRYGTSTRPVRELKGFRWITLAARGTQTVFFTLTPQRLSY